jgi:nitroimidazol reductase NimA-like FMN-containing flavoprotein (pyridoxamine 5'-phosphate oxidase superfamily)
MLPVEDVRAFLDRSSPALIGVVGTLHADGGPHLVPESYRYDGERVHIWTLDTRRRVKNLARASRVDCSVQEDTPPFAAVTMRGRATILTSEGDGVSLEILLRTASTVAPRKPGRVAPHRSGWVLRIGKWIQSFGQRRSRWVGRSVARSRA